MERRTRRRPFTTSPAPRPERGAEGKDQSLHADGIASVFDATGPALSQPSIVQKVHRSMFVYILQFKPCKTIELTRSPQAGDNPHPRPDYQTLTVPISSPLPHRRPRSRNAATIPTALDRKSVV